MMKMTMLIKRLNKTQKNKQNKFCFSFSFVLLLLLLMLLFVLPVCLYSTITKIKLFVC